jgi:hypothetical protein
MLTVVARQLESLVRASPLPVTPPSSGTGATSLVCPRAYGDSAAEASGAGAVRLRPSQLRRRGRGRSGGLGPLDRPAWAGKLPLPKTPACRARRG